VPVIYDPANPARSLIATADTAASHGGGALRFTGALAAVLALVLAALLAVPAIATLATPFDPARGRPLVG